MTVLKHRGKFDLAILLFLIAFPLAPLMGFNVPWTRASMGLVLGLFTLWHCLVALKTKTIFELPSQHGTGRRGYLNMEDDKSYFWWIFIWYVIFSILCFWLSRHEAYYLFNQL